MEKVSSKTSDNWGRVFQIALKCRVGVWEFCLEEFCPFSAFVILQIRLSNCRLIKISTIYLYIKPAAKKWYHSNDHSYKWSLYWESQFGEGGISGVGNEHCFGCWVRFSTPSTGFAPNVSFWGRGKAVNTWWGQQAR